MKKLSDRAKLLLRLVASRTVRDSTGKLERFLYLAPGRDSFYVEFDYPGKTHAGELGLNFIVGGGDYRSLQALIGRGLIEVPPNSGALDFYALTQAGQDYLKELDSA